MMSALVAVVASSTLGSLHCLAMCGPLVAVAHPGATGAVPGASRLGLAALSRTASLHSLGRLVAYLVLGAAAGLVGAVLNLAGNLANVQRVAAIVSAVFLVAWGLWMMFGKRAVSVGANGGAFGQGLVQLRRRAPRWRPLWLGMLTGLLPCGWLWAFVASAAGAATWWGGAATMAAFWLGSLPVMVGVVSLGGRALTQLRGKASLITGLVLVVLGLYQLVHRWDSSGAAGVTAPSCCHRGAK